IGAREWRSNQVRAARPGGELGALKCNLRGIKTRRILNAAIINCSSSPVALTRHAHDVPVAGFGKFFLTVPAAAGAGPAGGAGPYAEFLGLIKPTDNVNHDMVQLYR